MRLHRFIGDFDLAQATVRITDHEIINQFKNVLRLQVGHEVVLSDGKTNEARGVITALRADGVDIEILSCEKNTHEPKRHVALYCAILKRENFELVAQKVTELGVAEIIPMTTKRTVKLNLRHDRIEKIIKEAAEQSGRGVVPILGKTVDFETALKQAEGMKIFFDASGKLCSMSHVAENNVALFVGPEGGWDPSEITRAKEAECVITSLSALTLRAETAAIVGCANMYFCFC